jgi:uncharacterized protein (DUF4415 family)
VLEVDVVSNHGRAERRDVHPSLDQRYDGRRSMLVVEHVGANSSLASVQLEELDREAAVQPRATRGFVSREFVSREFVSLRYEARVFMSEQDPGPGRIAVEIGVSPSSALPAGS